MVKNIKVKTSYTIDKDILEKIEEYRATQRPIPTRTKAIEDLILKGLESNQTPAQPKVQSKTEQKQPLPTADPAKKALLYGQQLKDSLSNPFK